MKQTIHHLSIWFSILFTLCQTASASEWSVIAQLGKDKTGQAAEWTLSKACLKAEALSGDWVIDNGLESRMEGRKEARYAISFSGEFPAVRVEYRGFDK